jgi:hypothetical protein
MDNFKDLFVDINNFDVDTISYIKPILFFKVTKNMGIYYKKETISQAKSERKNVNKKKNKKKAESDSFKSNPDSFKSNPETKKQKIIIKTPKMIVPFGVKEFDNNGRKSYQMSLSFSTLTNLYNEEEIKKFYLFIQKIDAVNEETILDYKTEWGLPKNIKYKKTLQRLSNDYPHHMNITLPYDDKMGFLFHVYDEKAVRSGINIIEKKSIVSLIIELTDLRFTETDFRSNWTAIQIRKFKPYSPIQDFFMSGCFICDEDDPEDTAYAQIVEKYQKSLQIPISLPKIPQLNPNPYQMQPFISEPYIKPPPIHNIPPPPPANKQNSQSENKSTFIAPTLEELLSAKNTLKKTKTVVKGFMQNNSNTNGNDNPKNKSSKKIVVSAESGSGSENKPKTKTNKKKTKK